MTEVANPTAITLNPDEAIAAALQPSLMEAYELGAKVLEEAELVTVTNAGTAEAAKDVSVRLSRIEKAIEERRTEIVKPLNEEVKSINNLAKKLTSPFANAKNAISRKVIVWQNEVRRIQEEERKAQAKLEADALLASAAQPAHQAPAVPMAPAIKPQAKVISTRKVKSYTVTDINQVPGKYLMTVVNDAAVKEAMNAGITAIPGIHIIETETPIFR